MSVSQEIEDTGESFWEVGQHKRTVKRLQDGNLLCGDLATLVTERSEIEKSYAKQLRTWAKKWHETLGKGPEYGTLEGAWRGVLLESEKLCELHLKVRERLVNEVHASIKHWQKDSYHKSMMSYKEVKEAEDGFKKAQKPWSKRLDKVNKTKRDYHLACKGESSAINQERNLQHDTSVADDVKRKMAEKVQKAKTETENHKDRYQTSLEEIASYNARYMEDMTEQFEKCQATEKKRQEFFKSTLLNLHNCLDLSHSEEYDQIYADLHQTIMNADSSKDLRWWSTNHGVDMAMKWPSFQEYSPEMVAISRKSKKDKEAVGDGITLRSINLGNKEEREDPLLPAEGLNPIADRATSPSYDPNLNPFGDADEDEEIVDTPSISTAQGTPSRHSSTRLSTTSSVRLSTPTSPVVTSVTTEDKKNGPSNGQVAGVRQGSTTSGGGADPVQASVAVPAAASGAVANPFEDEEDGEEEEDELVDDGTPGQPVRALYDYDGAEADELTFKSGDLLDKLADEDDQGWCKGRRDGKVGLYPANYCESV